VVTRFRARSDLWSYLLPSFTAELRPRTKKPSRRPSSGNRPRIDNPGKTKSAGLIRSYRFARFRTGLRRQRVGALRPPTFIFRVSRTFRRGVSAHRIGDRFPSKVAFLLHFLRTGKEWNREEQENSHWRLAFFCEL